MAASSDPKDLRYKSEGGTDRGREMPGIYLNYSPINAQIIPHGSVVITVVVGGQI